MIFHFNPLILKPPKQFKAPPPIFKVNRGCSYCYKHLGEWSKETTYPLHYNKKKVIVSYKGNDYLNLVDNNLNKNPKTASTFWSKI